MVTATKTYVSSKATSELYKADNSKTISKSETYKSNEFKKVLNSRTNSKDKEDTKKVDDVDNNETSIQDKDTNEVNKDTNKADTDTNKVDADTSKVDKVKEKLKELEEDSKSSSKDEISDVLTELANLLNQLGINVDNIKSNGKVNSDILKTTIEGINGKATSNNSLSGVMEKLMQLLQTDSAKGGLDTDSLKTIEKLLSNLSTKLADDNTGSAKDIKSGIKDLTSQISNMLDNKQSQSEKVLTLEDMLNKKYSQENKESSTEKESNNATASKENSKEDKFLNSLLDDKTDSSTNKINLFASRTQTIQTGTTNTVNGFTINKATLTDDLIKDVKYMSNNGLKELTVKINPGNLGEITINLVEEDGTMKANLKANSKETAALLAQNLAAIKTHLSEQNIKIADVNIELYHEDTTFFNGEGLDSQLSQEQQKNSYSDNKQNVEINTDDSLIETIQNTDNGNVSFLA